MKQAAPHGVDAGHARLLEAAALRQGGKPGMAAKVLREHLARHPDDASALYMLGEIAAAQGHDKPALDLLTRSLKASPGFHAARSARVHVLLRLGSVSAALTDVQALLRDEPRNPDFRALHATVLEAVGDYAAAVDAWRALAQEHPDSAACLIRLGTALRLLGRREECVAAYRQAIAINPASGDAWWALADLKTFQFTEHDVARMQEQLASPGLAEADRVRLHFALGKANADRARYEASFDHYAQGNALHRATIQHDPAVLSAYVADCKKVFTADFFARRGGFGDPSRAPIFVVGMMRSGSTLVEQILASHSQIEGTRELTDLAAVSGQLQNHAASKGLTLWQALEKMNAADAAALGARYLDATSPHRRLGKPFFLDKMGANFALIGLIQMILPQARIIDVRRHPMACGFSIFSQLFPQGQNDCYRLEDIGRAYHDYVELTANFDAALPGRIHRVFYEDLVTDPEQEIRRLFDHLDQPFEAQSLDFHKTQRAVSTVSSEQVRKPIYKEALDQWRHFEPWLEPLAQSLGPVLAAYPSVPGQEGLRQSASHQRPVRAAAS
jgi:tetratricopeptide (TPR) repeat protein